MIYTVDNLPKSLSLSREGEHKIISYSFDFSAWVDEYGEGTFFIKAQRPTEETPYIASDVTIEDNIATWIVTNADTGINGIGAIELNYNGEEFHKKSPIIKTLIRNALDTEGEVPDAYEDWLVHITELANTAIESATNAAESAESAAESASEASEYKVKFTDENADGNIEITLGGV